MYLFGSHFISLVRYAVIDASVLAGGGSYHTLNSNIQKYSDLQNKLPVAIKINVVNVLCSLSYWLGFYDKYP